MAWLLLPALNVGHYSQADGTCQTMLNVDIHVRHCFWVSCTGTSRVYQISQAVLGEAYSKTNNAKARV